MKKYIILLVLGIVVVLILGYAGHLISQLMNGSTAIFEASHGTL